MGRFQVGGWGGGGGGGPCIPEVILIVLRPFTLATNSYHLRSLFGTHTRENPKETSYS